MNAPDILALPSMPLASPSYPHGPYRFVQREYLIITYRSDPDAIRAALPDPLQPDGSGTVLYEFIRMPDSVGFGDHTESGIVIPALMGGEPVNFTAQMYLDDDRGQRGCTWCRTSTLRWLICPCAVWSVGCISSPTSRCLTAGCCTTSARPPLER